MHDVGCRDTFCVRCAPNRTVLQGYLELGKTLETGKRMFHELLFFGVPNPKIHVSIVKIQSPTSARIIHFWMISGSTIGLGALEIHPVVLSIKDDDCHHL